MTSADRGACGTFVCTFSPGGSISDLKTAISAARVVKCRNLSSHFSLIGFYKLGVLSDQSVFVILILHLRIQNQVIKLSCCTTRDAAIFSCSSKSQCCNQPCLSFLTSQGGLVSIILMLYGEPKWPKCSFYCWWQIARLVPLVIENTGRAISRKLYPVHWRPDSFTAAAKIKISNIDPLPLPMTHDRTNAGNTEMWQIQIGKSQSLIKSENTKHKPLPLHTAQMWLRLKIEISKV